MFQFRAFPSYTYLIQYTIAEYCSAVLPHSEISGSQLICSSPKLIAACRVLHRLLMPRHSPCALISFTIVMISHNRFSWIMQVSTEVHVHKIVFTLYFLKSSTIAVSSVILSDHALCCLAFHHFLCSVFKVQIWGMYPQNWTMQELEKVWPRNLHEACDLVRSP